MKRFSDSIILLACIHLIFISCTATESTQPNPAGEIEVAWQQFIDAWEAEDAATCASFYHDNALNIPNGFGENRGREAIREFYSALFDANLSSTYTHKTESISFSGNIAIEHANFTVNWVNNENAEWTYRARVLVHWQRNEEGRWLIKNLLFNTPPEDA
jgi:uncharacterized protein (TIGR02246 family)